MKKLIALMCIIAILLSFATIGASAYTISENAGADNSTAEFYVYGYLGDVDLSGDVNIKDATNIQKHCANIITFKDTNLILADTDLSGDVNVKDSTLIQKTLAGLDPTSKVNHLISADSAEITHVHAYTMASVPSTCIEAGCITYTCECGEAYETPLALTSHNLNVFLMNYFINENGEYERTTYSVCATQGCWGGGKEGFVSNEILSSADGEILTVANNILSVSQNSSFASIDLLFAWEATPFKICSMLTSKAEMLDKVTYKIKVSDLNEFTLYHFGQNFDWKDIPGLPYDEATDTVTYTVTWGMGGGTSVFPESYKDNGDGTYTIPVSIMYEPLCPATRNCGTLTIKKLDTGFAPVSLVLDNKY